MKSGVDPEVGGLGDTKAGDKDPEEAKEGDRASGVGDTKEGESVAW